MSVIASLDIAVNAQTAQFQAAMGGVSKKTKQTATEIKEFVTPLSRMTQVLDGAGLGASSFIKTMGSFAAIGAGIAVVSKAFDLLGQSVEAIGRTTYEAIERLDDLGDTAARLGTSASGFSELAGAGRLADVEVAALTQGLTKFQQILGDALNGNKTAAASFDKLGLSADGLSKLSITDAFKRVAQALSEVDGEARRASMAQDIFGKGAAALAPLLRDGAAGVEKFVQQAKEMGLTISDIDAENIGAASDGMRNLGMVLEGIQNQLAKELSPAVAEISSGLTGIAPALREGLIPALKEINAELEGIVAVVVAMEEMGQSLAELDKGSRGFGGLAAKELARQLPGGSLISMFDAGMGALAVSNALPALPGVQKRFDAKMAAAGGFGAIPGKAFGMGEQPAMVDAPRIATRRGNLIDGGIGGAFDNITKTQSELANRLAAFGLKSRIGMGGKGIGAGFQDPAAVSAFRAGLGGIDLPSPDVGGIEQPKFDPARVAAAQFGSTDAASTIARAMNQIGSNSVPQQQLGQLKRVADGVATLVKQSKKTIPVFSPNGN